MSGYRSGAGCEFCDEVAVTWCARCHCHVCPAHEGAPHCTMCAKEAKEQTEDTQLFAAIVGWLGRLVFRPAQPQEIPFSRRSPEDIRAWRRKAGIRLRTQ